MGNGKWVSCPEFPGERCPHSGQRASSSWVDPPWAKMRRPRVQAHGCGRQGLGAGGCPRQGQGSVGSQLIDPIMGAAVGSTEEGGDCWDRGTQGIRVGGWTSTGGPRMPGAWGCPRADRQKWPPGKRAWGHRERHRRLQSLESVFIGAIILRLRRSGVFTGRPEPLTRASPCCGHQEDALPTWTLLGPGWCPHAALPTLLVLWGQGPHRVGSGLLASGRGGAVGILP